MNFDPGGNEREGGQKYQKCTVFTPTGLFHMRCVHDCDAPSPAAVLWNRAPAWLGRKNWRARKAGRAARKRWLAGDMVVVFLWFVWFYWWWRDRVFRSGGRVPEVWRIVGRRTPVVGSRTRGRLSKFGVGVGKKRLVVVVVC